MISPLLNEVVAGQAPELMTFSVEQYHRLTETGVLLEGSPVELIEGVIVRKDRRDQEGSLMNHGPNHGFVLAELHEILRSQLNSDAYHVRNQLPVTLSDDTEPEPDLAIVSGKRSDYVARHPGPADLLAAIEVAYSSVRFDTTTKQRIYASANIPVYWVVNLMDRRLTVFTNPSQGTYQTTSTISEDGVAELALSKEDVATVRLAELFPPAVD